MVGKPCALAAIGMRGPPPEIGRLSIAKLLLNKHNLFAETERLRSDAACRVESSFFHQKVGQTE